MSAERLTRGGALTTATREGVLFTAAAAAAAPSGEGAAVASEPELSTTGTCGGSGQAAIVGMAAAGEREIPPGGPKLSLSKQPFPRRRRAKGAALGDCSTHGVAAAAPSVWGRRLGVLLLLLLLPSFVLLAAPRAQRSVGLRGAAARRPKIIAAALGERWRRS